MTNSHAFDTGVDEYCPFMPVFAPPNIMFERGRGTELWDSNGRRYLDFLSGIAVVSLGHSNPVIAEAVSQQMQQLCHVSNFFANPVATRAARQLNSLLFHVTGAHGQVFLCNSGAEANEAALKLARKFGGRGRHVVVSALGSFHGRTLATLAATGQPAKHEPFQPLPEGFRHVEYGDIGALEGALDASVAAVLIESIQGEGGVITTSSDYLRDVRDLCTRTGTLMMIDEVQTGLGRTGQWFGFQKADGSIDGGGPDVVTMAKALGNGFPVGACWARREIAEVFRPGDHGSTYSGTAVAGAAISAVLSEMQRLDAPALARDRGRYLTSALEKIEEVHSVRGRGLLLGVEFGPKYSAKEITQELLVRGIVANAVSATALRLAPPLTISEDEIDEFITALRDVLVEAKVAQ